MAPGKKKAPKSKSRGIGVDFKKVKHKVGRKLAPAQNATKLEFKSKAVVLPGQSLAQNKDGCAVNQRRQTLKELLNQTTHYSERVRKESLFGIRDLITRHPKELASHSILIIQKLSPRMTDTDQGVRRALLLLFRSTIFPALRHEVVGLLLPIIMAHLSSAMTHLAMDVRLTAIHFLDILLQHYPLLLVLAFKVQVLQYYSNYFGKGTLKGEDTSAILITLKSLLRFLRTLQVDAVSSQRKSSKVMHRWLQTYNMYDQAPSEALEALHGYKSNLSESESPHTTQNEVLAGDEFEKSLEELVSKLLECWRGFVPEVCSTPSPDSTSICCMVAITKALTYIFRNLMREAQTFSTKEISYRSVEHVSFHKSWMVFMPLQKKFFPIVLHHLMPTFPIEAPPIHLQKVEEDLIALNVGICEVLLHFIVPENVQNDINGCKDTLDCVLNCYVQFLNGTMLPSSQLLTSIKNDKLSEPHLKTLLYFIPRIVPIVSLQWRDQLLQAFTRVFESSNTQSTTKLVCLSAMTRMLSEGEEMVVPLKYQQIWLQSLPKLLWELKHTHPTASKAVLQMLLHLGRSARDGSLLSDQYSSLQPALIPFLCTTLPTRHTEGTSVYGPFVKLPHDCQELAVDLWCYFRSFSQPFLTAVANCCLCMDVNVSIVLRTVEVMHKAFFEGRVHLQRYMSFLLTLLVGSCSQVIDDWQEPSSGKVDALDMLTRENRRRHYVIFRSISICIAEMGDGNVVLQLLAPPLYENLVKSPKEMLTATMRILTALSRCKERRRELVLPQMLANLLSKLTIQKLLSYEKEVPDKNKARQILLRCCITLFFIYKNFPQCFLENFLLSINSDTHAESLKGFELLSRASKLLLEFFKQAGIVHHLLASESIIKSILESLQVKVDSGSTEGYTHQELKNLSNQLYTTSSVLFSWQMPKPSEIK